MATDASYMEHIPLKPNERPHPQETYMETGNPLLQPPPISG